MNELLLSDSGRAIVYPDFIGEVPVADFITYDELKTLLNFQGGTVNKNEGSGFWLRFIVDGVVHLIPKVSLMYSVSYNQIYQNGSVYGTLGPGIVPTRNYTGGPVDQNKVVTIKGKKYTVRLLEGSESDPNKVSNGFDKVGTYNSEWSRFFYPICIDPKVTSFRGNRQASYTLQQLGFLSTQPSFTWCQEVHNRGTNGHLYRIWRGAGSVGRIDGSFSSDATSSLAFRPVLIEKTD